MKNATQKIVLACAFISGAFLFSSCSKSDSATPANPVSKDHLTHNNLRTTSCSNPFAWIGTVHNEALTNAMSVNQLPATTDGVLNLAKTSVVSFTHDGGEQAIITNYAKASLIASGRLTKALIANDDNVIMEYCTPQEATLLKQLFSIARQPKSTSTVIDEINDWSCGVMNDATLPLALRNRILATTAVMTNSMTYWTAVYGDTTPEARIGWFGGDAVGALVGFSIGGPWGALIGAVAGSVAVGCFGAEVYKD